MNASCGICLGSAPPSAGYHTRCLQELFRAPVLPRIDLDQSKLLELAMAMVGHTSISGVQKQISLTLDRAAHHYAVEQSQYILKPSATTFPELPENEHATMRLAQLFRIPVPPCGLVRLTDGTVAYIVRRFDRLESGAKLRMEDFCQLSQLSPKQKYDSTAERCVKLLRTYATEPLIDIAALYRLLVFAWWTGNGDMHLKNLSLLTGPDGRHQLSPAYDLVATDIYPGLDQGMALSLDGRKSNLTRPVWLRFAGACGVATKAAARVLDDVSATMDRARELISSSWLSEARRDEYLGLLELRAKSLV